LSFLPGFHFSLKFNIAFQILLVDTDHQWEKSGKPQVTALVPPIVLRQTRLVHFRLLIVRPKSPVVGAQMLSGSPVGSGVRQIYRVFHPMVAAKKFPWMIGLVCQPNLLNSH